MKIGCLLLVSLLFASPANAAGRHGHATFALKMIVECGSAGSEHMYLAKSKESLCVSPDVVADGLNLTDVSVGHNELVGQDTILLWLDDAGARRLKAMTRQENIRIAVLLNGKPLAAPFVHGPLSRELVLVGVAEGEKLKRIVEAIRLSMRAG